MRAISRRGSVSGHSGHYLVSGRHVLVVGSLNVDLVVRAPKLPGPGETVAGGTLLRAGGGKGANQALAAARLGATVTMIGRVGRDGFGRTLVRDLRAEGVSTRWVRRTEAATGVALIIVDSQGENSIALAPGANALLLPSDLPARVAAAADVLLAQLETPLPTVEHALRAARRAGVRTVLNAAPADPEAASLLEWVDVLIVNEHELATLLGRDQVPPGAEVAAARALQAVPEQVVVVTLGARGALAVAREEVVTQPTWPVQVVDATGAGDAFVAAFACAYRSGDDLAHALRVACAAGALATTQAGAQPSLPRTEQLEDFLTNHP